VGVIVPPVEDVEAAGAAAGAAEDAPNCEAIDPMAAEPDELGTAFTAEAGGRVFTALGYINSTGLI